MISNNSNIRLNFKQTIRSFYVKARKRVHNESILKLRQKRLVMSVVKHFQPSTDAPQIYRPEGPLGGHYMRVPVQNVYPMVWGNFEPDVCNVIINTVKPAWTVLDIGAHIGHHTLLMAKIVERAGRVISFEPLPENQNLLEENVMLNGYQDNVRIERMAVADKTSLLRLHNFMDRSQAFLDGCSQEVATHEGDVVVPVCALDDYFELLDWPRVNFVKMDIEGAESRAIAGMREVIKRHRPIILMESHGEQARDGIQYLIDNGYQLNKLDPQGKPINYDIENSLLQNEHWLLRP